MFRIVAKFDRYDKMRVNIVDAPARAVVELRIQNTMNGKAFIMMCECDQDGNAAVNLEDFGQYYAITARILTESNDEILFPLHFSEVAMDGSKFIMEPNAHDSPRLEPTHSGSLSDEGEAV